MKFFVIILYTGCVLFFDDKMKKSLIVILWLFILVAVIRVFLNKGNNVWDIMDWPWMVNDVSSYKVVTQSRWDAVGEDIFVYDENDKLVLSLDDESQPQYFFALYENYIVLDSGTSVSKREMLVYDIKSEDIIFETDYYPWESWLVLNDDSITFYKEISESLWWSYTLPNCENDYDNGYIENYWYTIWEDQANDLGDFQCAYFE